MVFLFNLLLSNTAYATDEIDTNGNSDEEREVYNFGPGVHVIDDIVLSKPHALVKGAGPGVTILLIKGGIKARAANPVIKDLTIIGKSKGIGIHLSNTWRAIIQDVKIEDFAIGIKFELSSNGREQAGGKTLSHWPSSLTKGNWGSRVTLSEVRGIEITGPGRGIVFENQLKKTNKSNYWKPTDDRRPGEFINATTIWGGHIAVKGTAIYIGDGVYGTKMYDTYIDVSPEGGIIMEYGARGLTLVGVTLDPNTAARKAKTPRIIIPKKARSSVIIQGARHNDNNLIKEINLYKK